MNMKEKLFFVAWIAGTGILLASTVTEIVDHCHEKKKERVELERRLTRVEDKLTDCDSRSYINKLEINSISKKLKILEGKKN